MMMIFESVPNWPTAVFYSVIAFSICAMLAVVGWALFKYNADSRIVHINNTVEEKKDKVEG